MYGNKERYFFLHGHQNFRKYRKKLRYFQEPELFDTIKLKAKKLIRSSIFPFFILLESVILSLLLSFSLSSRTGSETHGAAVCLSVQYLVCLKIVFVFYKLMVISNIKKY